jgi:hypothetical protein
MKKIIALFALAVVGASALGANTTDLLIWNIDLTSNQDVENKLYNQISQFYLKSTEDGTMFNLANYTYTDPSLAANTKVKSNFEGDLGPTDFDYAEVGLPGFYQPSKNMYTDWSSLKSAIYAHTGETDEDADFGAWEFFMQLDNNGNMIAWSEHLYDPSNKNATALYLDAVVPGSVYNSNMLNPGTTIIPFNFGSHLVPEPTSGLLMMLGAGLLALRRRRRA